MPELRIRQNEVLYAGIFRAPAFQLWNEGKKILSGLYAAFADYGITAAEIESISTGTSIAGQEVALSLHSRLQFRFKFDRIEARLSNFDNDELSRLPQVISKGAGWIASELGSDPFALHLFTYQSHSALSSSTAQEVLRSHPLARPSPLGEDRGSGIIYHFDLKDKKARVQLTIDHSLSVADGIYLNMVYASGESNMDFSDMLLSGRQTLVKLLEPLELTLESQ